MDHCNGGALIAFLRWPLQLILLFYRSLRFIWEEHFSDLSSVLIARLPGVLLKMSVSSYSSPLRLFFLASPQFWLRFSIMRTPNGALFFFLTQATSKGLIRNPISVALSLPKGWSPSTHFSFPTSVIPPFLLFFSSPLFVLRSAGCLE